MSEVSDYERFVVMDGQTVSLKAGTFSNPTSYDGSGAAGEVQTGGTLTAEGKVVFVGNTANPTLTADSAGGAVLNGGTITLLEVAASGNWACSGGAFANTGDFTVKQEALFEKNTSVDDGGALRNQGECIFLQGSTFTLNASGYDGGGICNEKDASVTMSAVRFEGNTAKRNGGAVRNAGRMEFTGEALFIGNAAKEGGAIYNENTLTFSGATFCGNYSSGDGAAIYNGGTLEMERAVFSGNSSAHYGGAIYNTGTVSIKKAEFYNGRSDRGGSVYNTGTLTMDDATFQGDYGEWGSALYNYGGTATIHNLNVSGGDASYGSVIGNSGGSLSILGGTISRNGEALSNYSSGNVSLTNVLFSENNGGNDSISGGAINNSYSYVAVSGCTFTKNSCGKGGAVHNWGSMWVSESVFCENFSGMGAGFFNDGDVEFVNANFTANRASGYGGGVYNCRSMTVSGGTFSGNYAAEGYGGAIFNNGGTLTATGVTFVGNTSGNRGGAIYNKSCAVFIQDSAFSKNVSVNEGGAIYVESGAVTVTDSTFTENSGGETGGAICVKGGTLTLSGVTFSNNHAPKNQGGAVYNASQYTNGGVMLTGSVTLSTFRDTIYNSGSFTWRVDGDNAGYLNDYTLLTNDGGTLAITIDMDVSGRRILAGNAETADGETFTLNGISGDTATITVGGETVTYGGVDCTLSVQDGDLVLTTGKEFDRIVVRDGESVALTGGTYQNPLLYNKNGGAGAVFSGGTLTGNQVVFSGNTVTENGNLGGGALYNAGTVEFSGATFSNNLCHVYGTYKCYWNAYGGAIFNDSGTLTLADTTFCKNVADCSSNACGGAIYNQSGMVTLTKVRFDGGTARNGAALYNAGGTVTILDGVFSENYAVNMLYASDGNGGGIYNQSGAVTAKNTTFYGNRGQAGYGGAIYSYGGTADFTDCDFLENYSPNWGGAILATDRAALQVTGGTFFGNNGGNKGGAIYAYTESAVVKDALFNGNISNYGGAIYALQSNMEVTGGTFTGNGSCNPNLDSWGGAICNDGGTISITGGWYQNNKAFLGGALYNTGTLDVTGGTFCSNYAARYYYDAAGGAIYNAGGTVTLKDAVFSGNAAIAGGAVYNTQAGVLSLTGNVELSTVSDTMFNQGLINWDLTGENVGYLNDYSLLTNVSGVGTLSISVDAETAVGVYAIAGKAASASGQSFTLNVGTEKSLNVTVGESVSYRNRTYSLGVADGTLALTVAGPVRFVATKENPVTLAAGACTNPVPYYGNGGAGEIQVGGELRTSDGVNFIGSTALVWEESAGGSGGAVANYWYAAFGNAVFYNNRAETSGGALANYQVADWNGQLFFSTNSAKQGGAIYNAGVINVRNSVTMVTESDTWVNEGGETSFAVTNWDLRYAPQSNVVCVNSYQYFSNVGDKTRLTLTVNANQALGHYTIATGDLSDVSGKDTFTLTMDGTDYSGELVANGAAVTYQGRMYLLGIYSGSLIVSVYESQRFVATPREAVTLEAGKTYSNTLPYSGNGGAGEVLIGGTLDAAGDVAFVADAVVKKGDSDSGKGGAIINSGTAQLQKAAFTYNSADFGGAIENVGEFTFSDTATFVSNAARESGGAVDNYSWLTCQKDASFVQNYSFKTGGAVSNHGNFVLANAIFYGNVAVQDGGGIYNDHVVDVTGSVSFSTNSAALGGAVYNENLIHLAGVVTLVTDTDTWVNRGGESSIAITNWDLRNAEDGYSVRINNFEHFSNLGGNTRQTITVNAEQETGDYVIATGDLSDLTGKDSFLITVDNAEYSEALVAGGEAITWAGRRYQLGVDKTELILSVTELPALTTGAFADDTGDWDCGSDLPDAALAGDFAAMDADGLLGGAEGAFAGESTATWSGTEGCDESLALFTDGASKPLLANKIA